MTSKDPKTITDFSSVKVQRGKPYPLGIIFDNCGYNFSIFSKHANKVILCIFHPEDLKPALEISLDPCHNRTGHIWHVLIEHLPPHFDYGYRFDGSYDPPSGQLFQSSHLLIDPFNPLLTSQPSLDKKNFRSQVKFEEPYDWEEEKRPNLHLHDLIIYEMHVKGFTKASSSQVKHPGTFRGIMEKIPYLKDLGINAIELMPIFAFDEEPQSHLHPQTKTFLPNYWGYSPISFFSLMNAYASNPDPVAARGEFKDLVKALHQNGIEIFLDVVFNHTAEGNNINQYIHFRGIDNSIYYMQDNNGNYFNFSGCGNTFNCNSYSAIQLILSSLRYWVSEMHVDGFRFDLASILTRKKDGGVLSTPPVILAICQDPVLTHVKLIAEPWDAAGLYQVGHFPTWGKWSEWNDQYRDRVRHFIKGSPSFAGPFAEAISGSQNIYGRWHNPTFSVNFITSHDGFTLRDLVTYQEKHNLENGENNQDGSSNNISWNCGIEGPTQDEEIIQLRERQMRNFFLALLLSRGVPMILMGDEYGHTRRGNNNAWNQDNELNWFLWDKWQENKGLFAYVKSLIRFRMENKILRMAFFYKESDVDWHGQLPSRPNWSANAKLVACTLKDPHSPSLYIAFNPSDKEIYLQLPLSKKACSWGRVVDTFLPYPENCSLTPSPLASQDSYLLKGYSSVVLKEMVTPLAY